MSGESSDGMVMATRIKLKNSTVLNKVPTTADIEVGELAINANVGSPAAYIQDSSGNIVKLAGTDSINTPPDATETVKGIARIATTAEVIAGVDDTTLITPAKLSGATPATPALQAVTDVGSVTTSDITANAYYGDGSNLTGLSSTLQEVCDNGSTTTTGVTFGGAGSFGGEVTIPEAPTADTSATSKKYVDDAIASSISAEDFWDRDSTTLSPQNSGDNLDNIGSVTASSFTGTGTALTALNASNITSGTIDDNYLPNSISSDITGNAATATVLETARTIGGVSFDGSANVNLPGVNTAGSQDTTGNATTASALAATVTIGGVSFDGSANVNLPGVNTAGDQDTTGNAATATTLETARTIGGVSFDGSANIDLAGVNTAGNQDTSGNAGTATTLETARNINGTSFDGSGNITVTAAAGTLTGATLNSSVTASSLTSVGTLTNIETSGYLRGPATFTIDPAAHGANTGTLVVAGNLQVDGTTTTIDAETLTIKDKDIIVAKDSINKGAADGAGLIVDCGIDTDATILYDAVTDQWDFNNTITAPDATFAGDVQAGGDVTLTGDLTINTDAFFVDASAKNVGIGTASPTDNGSDTVLALKRADSGESASFAIQGASNASSLIRFADGTSTAAERNAGSIIVNHSDQSMTFGVQDAEAMRIDSSGNVGIGTTSPSTLLDVDGAATFAGNIKGGSAVYANTDGSRTDTQAVFIGYPSGGDSGASTTAILGNGSATFAGTVTANLFSGSLPYSDLTGTPTIPTNNNQLTNGAGYVTSSGNTIIGTDSDVDTSGADVVDQLNMTDGVITSHSTRTLTLANLGYTGATNANYITNNNQLSNGAGYVTSSGNTIIGTDSDIDTSGAYVVDQLNMTDGVITSHSTRALTLGNLGYTGASNANYITNNNQLTNGSGYVTSSGNTIIGTDSDVDTSGATVIDNIYMTDGVITSHGTRTLTLGNLGYTGATNANYITNNNQLSNGAGYLSSLNISSLPALP